MDTDGLLRPSWQPPSATSHLAIEQFREFVNSQHNVSLSKLHSLEREIPIKPACILIKAKMTANYDELHAFSIRRRNDFWLTLWDFLGIVCSVKPQQISRILRLCGSPSNSTLRCG